MPTKGQTQNNDYKTHMSKSFMINKYESHMSHTFSKKGTRNEES